MTNLTLLSHIITNSLMGSVFGDPILTGVVLLALGFAVFYKLGIPLDASLMVMIPTILLFGGYMLLPGDVVILAWFGMGIIGAIIMLTLLRK